MCSMKETFKRYYERNEDLYAIITLFNIFFKYIGKYVNIQTKLKRQTIISNEQIYTQSNALFNNSYWAELN